MPPVSTHRSAKTESAKLVLPFGQNGDVVPAMTSSSKESQELSAGLGMAAAELNREWFGFLDRRLRENVAFPQRLASCKDPAEALEVWAEFSQVAVADYLKELGKLTQLGCRAAATSINETQTDFVSGEKHQPRVSARR
jgi:hypothetical protein